MPAIPSGKDDDGANSSTLPIRRHKFTVPLLRLQLNDLSHEGSSIFLSNTHGNEDLAGQVQNVLNLLYAYDTTADSSTSSERATAANPSPPTRSVTFVLRSMGGVAYTTGSDLDSDHKEIHISLDYVKGQSGKPSADQRHEILGVLCHELVHCFQWNAEGTAPGGLIEGIADWVRLNAGLAARHWQRDASGKWDGGYQHTGYFLQYLEDRFGFGTVGKVNAGLRSGSYDEDALWGSCCGGKGVKELWDDYGKSLQRDRDSNSGDNEALTKEYERDVQ